MSWLRRQNLTKASCTMSSASAADCTHWRANRSNPGATSEKQFLQFSWLAIGSMTFSRSLLSRRRQVEILSVSANKKIGLAQPAGHVQHVTFSATRAESNLRANPDERLRSDTPGAIRQKNSREDCCKSRLRFANVRA